MGSPSLPDLISEPQLTSPRLLGPLLERPRRNVQNPYRAAATATGAAG